MSVVRRTDPVEVNGKKLYRVDVEETRRTSYWVLAEDKEAAQFDANNLDVDEWDDVDTDALVWAPSQGPSDYDPVWTGGPQGAWREWQEVRP